MHVCLAVTCHLHFWQNGWDLLCATVVTWGWNRYWNKSQHWKLTQEKKLSHHSCQDLNPWPFDHKFSALTTELSLLHMQCFVTKVFRHKFYQFNQNSIIKQTEQLFYPKAMWTRKSDLFVCITCILSTWQVSMHLAMTKTFLVFSL